MEKDTIHFLMFNVWLAAAVSASSLWAAALCLVVALLFVAAAFQDSKHGK